jgi:alpha-tubulin suppressor-like RCC1 family protein
MDRVTRVPQRAGSLAALGGVLVLASAGLAARVPAADAATGPAAHASVLQPGGLPPGAPGRTTGPRRLVKPKAEAAGVSSVLGWGQDSYGQLGNGAYQASQPTPAHVLLPAGTQVTGVSAGYDDSLVVTSAGGLLAFGRNEDGQLGDGGTGGFDDAPVNVSLASGTTVTQASAGDGFSLAVTSAGAALAWGDDEEGELGNGQVTSIPFPTPMLVSLPTGTTVTQVAAGAQDFGLALTSNGRVLAWGDNSAGQLGDGGTTNSDTPVRVELPSAARVTQVAAGSDTGYALTSAGTVYAWGYGAGGTLGDGTTANSDTPVEVELPSGTKVTQIASNGSFALALTSAGKVLAWGADGSGQLGDASTANSDVPVPVSLASGTKVSQVAAGGQFGLAVTSTGSALAWGENLWGELGNGTTRATGSDVPEAVSLPSGTTISTVAAGQYHALALPVVVPQVGSISPEDGLPGGGGTLTISGGGFEDVTGVRFGKVRSPSFTVVSQNEITAAIPGGTGRVNVTVTAAGGTSVSSPADQYTYLAKGSLLEWGDNAYGQLGNGEYANADEPVAVHLPAGTLVKATARGGYTSYALTSAGTVYAWGYGGVGELGDGSDGNSALPVKVSVPSGTVITAIAAGVYSAYALTSTGQVLAWGYNHEGELGDGSTAESSDVPVTVSLPSGTKVTAIAAEDLGGLALTSADSVLAWGYGGDGELGNGTTDNSGTPVTVSVPSGDKIASIAAGPYEGDVITSAGAELTWGLNSLGQLGDGTTADSDVPVSPLLPAATKIIAAAGGQETSYALTSTGKVLAWGYGGYGSLGDGTLDSSDVPVTVSLPAGTDVTAIAAEYYGGLARTPAGTLLAWGEGYFGDLGDGSAASSDVPVTVELPSGLTTTQVGPSMDEGGAAVVSPVTLVTGLSPSHGRKGAKITIKGLNLTGATEVTFGGVRARFTVVSATKITATVPAGKGTVAVRVTTTLGTSAKTNAGRFSYRG